MFSRIFSVPLLLGAAVAVPYVASQGTNLEQWLGDSAKSSTPGSGGDLPTREIVRAELPTQLAHHVDAILVLPGSHLFFEKGSRVVLRDSFRFA